MRPFLKKIKHLALRIVWSICIFILTYQYIQSHSIASSARGGTLVEAGTTPELILPYTQGKGHHFYQQLLFRGCVQAQMSGNNVQYLPDICTVTTKDSKTFTITLQAGQQRSDDTILSLEDIYFTYHTLIKENYRNVDENKGYESLDIQPYRDSITVQFPSASVDNIQFFLNPILPAHILSTTKYQEYLTNFPTRLVNNACARIESLDPLQQNFVLNLGGCDAYKPKFLQYKYFADIIALQEYQNKNPDIIDYILDGDTHPLYSGYTRRPLLTNTYLTLFFNVQKGLMSERSKAGFLKTSQESLVQSGIIQATSYLFPVPSTGDTSLASLLMQDQIQPRHIPTSLPDILLFSGEYAQNYTLTNQLNNPTQLTFIFPQSFSKIYISHNTDPQSELSTYTTINNSATYILSPVLRTIQTGNNIYTLSAYSGDTLTKTYKFQLYYGKFIQTEIGNSQNIEPEHIMKLKILYNTNDISSNIIQNIQNTFKQKNIDMYIEWMPISDTSIFEGALQAKDYDIVLSQIHAGLRKDLGNIFISDVPGINPSLYINQNLSVAISSYYLQPIKKQQEILDTIANIYTNDMPLGFLGKPFQSILVAAKYSGDALRIPSLDYRSSLLMDHQGSSIRTIQRNKVFSLEGIKEFMGKIGTSLMHFLN